jgi:hypothetical protein
MADRVVNDALAWVSISWLYTGLRLSFMVSAYDALCGMFRGDGDRDPGGSHQRDGGPRRPALRG